MTFPHFSIPQIIPHSASFFRIPHSAKYPWSTFRIPQSAKYSCPHLSGLDHLASALLPIQRCRPQQPSPTQTLTKTAPNLYYQTARHTDAPDAAHSTCVQHTPMAIWINVHANIAMLRNCLYTGLWSYGSNTYTSLNCV